MRFERIAIRGYGRLKNLELAFDPGLQVLLGPNERGKSTIRAFIADMLYGQKRRSDKRIYDDANELRSPWEDGDVYGGSLFYVLEDGTRIEVSRDFQKRKETIQVYDHTQAKDITGAFDRLRNKEIDFAVRHLGIGKSVFLGTATISHASLEALGDKDALGELRDKIMSLADSGDESKSASNALKRLEQRVASIGRANARTKPLPAAKARQRELERERAAMSALMEELAEVDSRRRALREETDALRAQKAGIETMLQLLDLYEIEEALRQADALGERIDMATQHCFALRAVRDFPVDKTASVQRAETRVETAKRQCERLDNEADELETQLKEDSGEEDEGTGEDIPEVLEVDFDDLSARHQSLRARLSDAEVQVENAERRLEESQDALQHLPDFGRVAPDPVEWLTQLSSSFSVALNVRREECDTLGRLQQEAAERENRLAPGRKLFEGVEDFPVLARAYVLGRRARENAAAERESLLRSFRGTHGEIAEDVPGLLWLSVICAMVLAGALSWFLYQRNNGILIAIAVLGICAVIFTSRWVWSKRRLAKLAGQIAALEAGTPADSDGAGLRPVEDILENAASADLHLIENMLESAACASVRELEALHDEYRNGAAELEARRTVLEEHEERAAEAEERIPLLLERYRETFARVNETKNWANAKRRWSPSSKTYVR